MLLQFIYQNSEWTSQKKTQQCKMKNKRLNQCLIWFLVIKNFHVFLTWLSTKGFIQERNHLSVLNAKRSLHHQVTCRTTWIDTQTQNRMSVTCVTRNFTALIYWKHTRRSSTLSWKWVNSYRVLLLQQLRVPLNNRFHVSINYTNFNIQ